MNSQTQHQLEKDGLANFLSMKQGSRTGTERQVHKRFKKGRYVYLPGEPADKVYFLTEGRIKIGAYGDSGKEVTKAIHSAGELFGELSLVGENKRHDFAYAMEDTVACVISSANLRSMIQDDNALSLFLMKAIGLRVLEMERRLESLVFKNSRTRVVEFLHGLGVKKGQRIGYEMLVRQFMTHQEIANLTATSRQTVTSVLNELRNRNLLTFNRKRLLIRDMKKLAEAAKE
ncbi:MAG: Crp/Fnr family transcriptional regulator [Lewinellaceae bacterium]|nr:Crp/Fnr family transcriptional regulator [Lewinellaceae bacterium]